jgi:hypothetical protein
MDETKALTVTADASLMPLVAPAQALAAWNAYQDLCKQVLDEKTDYANIKGKLAKKRSGFSKLARFYGVSIGVQKEYEWTRGDDWGWDWTLLATIPGGRSTTGDGSCSYSEMKGGGIAATRHNIRAKAYTRAFNRAVANVLGTGEVSAEEVGDDDNGHAQPAQPAQRQWQNQIPKPAVRPAQQAPKASDVIEAEVREVLPEATVVPADQNERRPIKNDWIANDAQRVKFWAQAHSMGYTSETAHATLKVQSMRDFEGSMDQAIDILAATFEGHGE